MHRLVLPFICALTVLVPAGIMGAGGGSSALAGQRGSLWVVNRGSDSVAVFDGSTGTLLDAISVGKEPNSVVVAPRTTKAYVTEEMSSSVAVVSTMTRQILGRIAVGSRPHHIRTSDDGKRLYVSEFGTNKIAVIETASDRLVAEFTTHPNPAARNHSSWITRDGKALWLVNEVVNEITVLDARTGALLFSLPVGNRPSEVIVSRDGKTAYVSVRAGENAVKTIDVATRSIVGTLALPAQPDTLQLTPDGRFLLIALRGTPAQLSVVDVRSLSVVTTVDVAGPGTVAGHNWISANGRYSFVSFEGGSGPGIAVVDHRSQSVVATYSYPGGGRPHGVYYDDPAATEGPSVTLAPAVVRVTGRRVARLRVGCSAEAVGFCRGRLTLQGVGSRRFETEAGRAEQIAVALSPQTWRRLVHSRRLRLRAVVTAVDQLGNRRATARLVTLALRG